MKKIFIKILLLLIFSIYLLPLTCKAGDTLLNTEAQTKMNGQTSAFQDKSGLETTSKEGGDLGAIMANLISAFFGLLGIIFLVLIILAGFNWMTAQGDEAKVKSAKDTIRAAIIGLLIVVAAYSITYFVFERLDTMYSETG